MYMALKVAVLGGGNGGHAAAADLKHMKSPWPALPEMPW